MSRFEKHFHLSEKDIIDYVKEKQEYFDADDPLICTEIGDGNINYVYRVENEETHESIVIKHADSVARISGRPMDPAHNRVEAKALALEGKIVPGAVPVLYYYDPVMCCLFMEDMKGYENFRYLLCRHQICEGFSDSVTDFMSAILMRTTDQLLLPEVKRQLASDYANPQMCEITERLVFTDPFTDAHRSNVILPENLSFVQNEIYEDRALLLEAATLKAEFKSNYQSLIHGDMHTGSILVKGKKFCYLDPEFSSYEPAGFDVGTVIGNLLLAYVNVLVTGNGSEKDERYKAWLEQTIKDITVGFYAKSLKILVEETTDRMAKVEGFAERYLKQIMHDTAGNCGAEMIRRIVGLAKVRDIAGIQDLATRVQAERIGILAAKDIIMNRQQFFDDGTLYINAVQDAAVRVQKSGI